MENSIEEKKEIIVLKYSIILALSWDVASYWLNLDLLYGFFTDIQSFLAGIALLVCAPTYLISLFVKRYNRLYVKCKMEVRKTSIRKGISFGLITYSVLVLLFYFVLGSKATGIYSTAALVVGCTSAHSHLKRHLKS